MRIELLAPFLVAALGCDVMSGKTNAYDDSVDLPALEKDFACDVPESAEAKRACKAIAAFKAGDKVGSYPSEGSTLFAGLRDCARGTSSGVGLNTIALEAGTSPGDVDKEHRAPGVMVTSDQFEMLQESAKDAVKPVMDKLAQGKGAELTSEQLEAGTSRRSWEDWRTQWTMVEPKPIPTAQSNGKSLLERPPEPGPFPKPGAYWRESNGALIRISPDGCVGQYYRLPDA